MNKLTAQQIHDFALTKNADVSFSRTGEIRVFRNEGTMLYRPADPDALAALIGTPANDNFAVTLDADGYYSLASVFRRAFDQASDGKGKERHANDLPFDQQPMQTIAAAHGVGFLTGQAAKKTQEAHGLPHDRAVAEILGAMNYLAGAVIFMEQQRKAAPANLFEHIAKNSPAGPYAYTRTEGMVLDAMDRAGEVADAGTYGAPIAPCANCTTACKNYVFGKCDKPSKCPERSPAGALCLTCATMRTGCAKNG